MRLTAIFLLLAVSVYGQGSSTPLYNAVLQSDLNAAGFKINGANLVDYAGTNLTWNVVTGKFDATGGGGGTPGGSTTQVQYNNAGAFGGISSMTTNGTVVTQKAGTNFVLADPTTPTNKASFDLSLTSGTKLLTVLNGGIIMTDTDVGSILQGYDADLAALAAITGVQGDVIYRNASTWVKLAAGTNGNQLTTHSTGANPTWDAPGSGGGGTWGTITGTLSSQTDLQAALDTKLATLGDLSPLFTTTEASQNGAFALTNAAATTVFGRAAGTSGAPTYSSAPQFLKIGNLTTNGFVKTGSSDGTLSVDTATYLTGNQNISLTGDVTGGPAATSIATTIGANKVTLGMMATMATDSILGRATALTGNVEVLAALPFAWSGGDITRAADSNTETINANAVTYAKMQAISATSKLLGSSTTTTPVQEITIGSGLTLTGTTLTAAAGGGTVTSITATSPIVVAPTPLTATGVVSLDKTVDLALTAVQTVKVSDAFTGSVTDVLSLGHNSSGTAANNFGTRLLFLAEDSTTNDINIGGLEYSWTNVTHNSNVSKVLFRLTNGSTSLATAASLTGAGLLDVSTGYLVAASALTGTILQGNGTRYGASAITWPTAASTANKVLKSDGSNLVMSTETYAVPGTAGQVLRSNATNWLSAALAFSDLSGSATAAQMPAFTGDVTSPAGSTVNTLVNIPLTTTIAGASGTRGDVLYYGATGWAKLGAGTSGNQLTTNGAGADPTWAAPGSGGSGTPGGANTNIQYNDSSAFGGDANLVWDKTVKKVTITGGGGTDSALKMGSLEFQPFALNNCWFGDNIYYDGAGFKYRATGASGQFYFFGPEGQFRFGASGTAGTAPPTFAQLKVNADGTVSLGGAIGSTTVGSYANSTLLVKGATAQIGIRSDYVLGWSGTATADGTIDTALYRNAGGVLEVNNGTPGTFKTLKDDVTNSVTGYQVNGAAPANYELTGNGTNFVSKASDIPNGSSAQQTGFASNTYLTGSVITISAGDFKVGSTYRCMFDMAKTTAGTAAPVITIYIGTNGSTADTAAQTITFAAATGVADTGMFEVWVNFRAVGASATISSVGRCVHNLAATGLTSTGASGSGTISNSTSSTFNSTAMTKIGIAFNGGASYVGTNNIVQAYYSNP